MRPNADNVSHGSPLPDVYHRILTLHDQTPTPAFFFRFRFIIPYPPGFPILVPGQIVTKEILEFLIKLDVKEIHGFDAALGLRVFTQELLDRLVREKGGLPTKTAGTVTSVCARMCARECVYCSVACFASAYDCFVLSECNECKLVRPRFARIPGWGAVAVAAAHVCAVLVAGSLSISEPAQSREAVRLLFVCARSEPL